MTLWRSFLLHLFWCCAIIAALVLSDEVHPWASNGEIRGYVLDAAVPQGVDPAQHLEQMKKSCIEETVRRRLNAMASDFSQISRSRVSRTFPPA